MEGPGDEGEMLSHYAGVVESTDDEDDKTTTFRAIVRHGEGEFTQAVDQTNSWLRESLSTDSDDLCEYRIGQVNLECVRNKVEGSACQSNDDCSCDLGLVTPGIADLFGAYPDYDSVILNKEGDMVVINIGKY